MHTSYLNSTPEKETVTLTAVIHRLCARPDIFWHFDNEMKNLSHIMSTFFLIEIPEFESRNTLKTEFLGLRTSFFSLLCKNLLKILNGKLISLTKN